MNHAEDNLEETHVHRRGILKSAFVAAAAALGFGRFAHAGASTDETHPAVR